MPGKVSDAFWGPAFARLYDRFAAGMEDAGLRDTRRELLTRARGRTVEIGAGTGANLDLYPDGIDLVLTEPDPHMARQLEKKLADIGESREVVAAGAESLPFPDESFDTAVSTLVLCTVDDTDAVLAELARVLKPGGRLLFLEHVRAGDPGLGRWQDRLERPWGWFARGCHPNRDTLASIGASPLEVAETQHDGLPKAPGIIRPMIVGEAIRPPAR
jgi:ubiquinone/menaquinone biosynthesis C-methylase UbiE